MSMYNDPYGIENLKAREKAEREKEEKNTLLLEQIAEFLKSMSER
jgi:hypothetical protein